MSEQVVLVDMHDNPIGTMEKLTAHQDGGHLHRALSVIIFDRSGRLLIQQRALHKYHCPWLWSNTACSHPRPGEWIDNASVRRLREEMGITTETQKLFTFIYKASFSNGLTEHEFDHVFVGLCDMDPIINTQEAQDRKRITRTDLEKDIMTNSQRYTPWFLILVREHREKLEQRFANQ